MTLSDLLRYLEASIGKGRPVGCGILAFPDTVRSKPMEIFVC